MAKELIVSVNGREKKIAIIENEKVTEFYIERGEGNQGIVGNIYKGRVMRVLPGMQSAFVDVGLERDAFLYVSDFFDEEEEFERIVIDKSQKGNVEEAQRVAAEQIALGRVERERHIESTQERVEPLRDLEPEEAAELEAEPAGESAEEQSSEGGDAAKRRGRRGRRRRGGREGSETEDAPTPDQTRIRAEDIDTPFVAADPSIQRIIDEEETAATGEMFKDARLQERLFDQIHAGEFNLGDDFRTAEVGSVLSSVDYSDDSFQRVDDGDTSEGESSAAPRVRKPIAAHIESFVDEVDDSRLQGGSFQRVSDDDAESERTSSFAETKELEVAEEEPVQERTSTRKSRVGKLLSSLGAKKKAPTKRSSSKKTKEQVAEEPADDSTVESSYADAEASLDDSGSRSEFATRRGGRRRRRPSKAGAASADAPAADSATEEATGDANEGNEPETEVVTEEVMPVEEAAEQVEEVVEPVASMAPQTDNRASRDNRETRGGRDSRDRGRTGRSDTRGGQRGAGRRDRQQPTITDLLREGQEILVQIAKEPIAKKGARITSHIALPGRFLVYMPTVEHVGVSRKIESDSERQRLRKLIMLIRGSEDIPSGGFIVRTAGVGISEADLREDVRYLVRTWLDIRAAAEKSKPATLVHKDLDLVQRILRDQLSDDFAAIRVDSEEEYEAIVEFINRIQPRMVKRVKLYTRDRPILESYGVQAEIDKAIKPRVWLKSGGYLVINQTEALVAIDVNTGKFVGRGSGRLEDTITRTNLEAVDEIVRQIRLRDLGGIIVLDLIDMEERRNRARVMSALQDALRGDKSPTKVLSFNDFGLVIMTRKRVKQSLERTLCSPCQYCQGAGLIKSPQTICYELLEEARVLGRAMNGDRKNRQATLRIHPEVAKALRSTERDVLNEIEEYLGAVDINSSDPTVHQEQFDFAFI
ncbi:MAG TPA: Rne/Rng family ribonuclease [Pyrinomonadaceae bacterium]|jgi:ribonuclease G|nr:Rne/Rng family ribonuclease [Pyrinomonadaceae bacterium]